MSVEKEGEKQMKDQQEVGDFCSSRENCASHFQTKRLS